MQNNYAVKRTIVIMVLSFVSQSEMVIYLVTEPVRPLDVQLNDGESSDVAISWGLHQITVRFISFILLTTAFSPG